VTKNVLRINTPAIPGGWNTKDFQKTKTSRGTHACAIAVVNSTFAIPVGFKRVSILPISPIPKTPKIWGLKLFQKRILFYECSNRFWLK
jgi:hypothetical protein